MSLLNKYVAKKSEPKKKSIVKTFKKLVVSVFNSGNNYINNLAKKQYLLNMKKRI